MSGEIGPTASTNVGDIVAVDVDPNGPYGIVFEADRDGHGAIVCDWEKLPNRKYGPVQRHGGVRIGDVLFCINERQLDNIPFDESMELLRNTNMLRKTLKFMNQDQYYRRKRERGGIGSSSLLPPGITSSSVFQSSIRRARVNQESDKRFAEYEIACQWRLVSQERVEKETIYHWSVWKRFSQFKQLDKDLKTVYGWQINDILFPSDHLMSTLLSSSDAYSVTFMQARKSELEDYWQAIGGKLDRKVFEFHRAHLCSDHIKVFLRVNEETNSKKPIQDNSTANDDNDDDAKPAVDRKLVRRQSTKSKRLKKAAGSLYDSNEATSTPAVQVQSESKPPPPPPVAKSVPPPPLPPAAKTITSSMPPQSSGRMDLLASIRRAGGSVTTAEDI